jgi:hypothetical protein
MSAADNLVFADFDGLNGPPTIDGFAMIDTGVITPEVEGGYINGGRILLGESSGLPPVVIQAIRDNQTIVLGISCRGDTSFDDIDGVVIGLIANAGDMTSPQRKIHIFPVWGDAPDPLDSNNLGTGYGVADKDLMNAGAHLFVPADDPQYSIRKNRPPHVGPDYYARDNASGFWGAAFTPDGASDTTRFNVRCRSWMPPVVGQSPLEYAWAIEVRLPISNAAAGGANWIDLADDFGLFIDVIRGGRQVNMDGDGEYFAAQFVFPIGAPDLGSVMPSTDIPLSSFGHGLMGAAAANGEGVRIKNGPLGIGRRPTGTLLPPSGEIRVDEPNTFVALLENIGPAAGKITAQVWLAQFGSTGGYYYTPHWAQPAGLENPSSPEIALPAGTVGSPSQGETTNDWDPAQIDTVFYGANRHQCIWVQLDSADSNVTFAQASVRRNMDFTGFSEANRDIVISGEGYKEPADGSGQLDFMLLTRCRKLVVRELVKAPPKSIDPATVALVNGALNFDAREGMINPFDKKSATGTNVPQWQDTVVYLWITECLLRTGEKIEINGIKAERLDASPGDFAVCARHEGVDDPMSWAFSGGGMVQYAPGVYGIKVPYKGKKTIRVRLAAGRQEAPGDRSELPRPGKTFGTGGDGGPLNEGCLVQLLRWLRLRR